MSTGFNISKGEVSAYIKRIVNNDPANAVLKVVLLQASELDAVLEDYDTLALLLAAAGNTEATFTNYARKVLSDVDLSAPVVDDTANTKLSSLPQLTYTAAGGAANNNIVKAVFCYDPDSTGSTPDSGLVPLSANDYVKTTDGNDMVIDNPNGFHSAG